MSDQIKEIKPFKQVPYTDIDAKLSITGQEFVAIQNLLNSFRTPLDAIQGVFERNINEGNITIKYIQQDGTEISKEEATQYLEKASEFLKSNDSDNEKSPN